MKSPHSPDATLVTTGRGGVEAVCGPARRGMRLDQAHLERSTGLATRTAGWMLLTITIWLFGSIASAQAHTLAAASESCTGVNSVATADRVGGHAGTVVPSPSINRGANPAPSKDQS